MRVLMKRGVLGEDTQSWGPGEIREASDAFGRWLIAAGKAVLAPVEVEEVVAVVPPPEVERPGLTTRKVRRK